MLNNQEIETKLNALVECLAKKYKFKADQAIQFLKTGTDVNHIAGFLTEEPVVEDPATEKIRKNIALWTKKLNDNKFKDEEARNKHIEKLEKEKKKLEKLTVVSEPVPEPEEKQEKRISRMSQVLSKQLKVALEEVNLEMTDKLKKEFVKFVDDLTEDDYRRTGLADHMREFAKSKVPIPETVEPEKEPEFTSDMVVQECDISELRTIRKVLKENTNNPGIYLNTKDNKFVTGPKEESDEDYELNTFNGKEYMVGVTSNRIYETLSIGDVFVGFAGIGQFEEFNPKI